MAKKGVNPLGKPLVIVESPTKAKTIGKFLGPDYMIEASIGHVRDLPKGKKDIPEEHKKEDWAYLGVNVGNDFEPVYVVPVEKKEQVRKLQQLLKQASELYLATDEDREGEAISWHLLELLKPKVPVHRLVFHEITRAAIHEAMEHPRQVDQQLVRAQETRRIVDRLYGYDVSPLLWRVFGRPGLSAGRVQSVAVRLIVDRERERMAFRSATYWDLLGAFSELKSPEGKSKGLQAPLMSLSGRPIPSAKDFDSTTGKLKDPKCLLLDEAGAKNLAARLLPIEYQVAEVEETPYSSRPYAPFTTSTLQQEANRKLRMTARRTMQVAQSLYENGYITYMRTDSTNLAAEAVTTIRSLILAQYGKAFVPDKPRFYSTKVKNAQEAHEAIRPAGDMPFPERLRPSLTDEQFRLYDLIWKRSIACQMTDSTGRRTVIVLEGKPTPAEAARFQVSGRTIDFPGYLRAYVEGTDDPDAELADQEVVLPPLAKGDRLRADRMEPRSHSTQPPARYTEPTLTRTLEQLGIGRPSTYASIIDTILERDYVFKRGQALVPTWTAFAVVQLLETHLTALVDYQFTARMEDDLDAISRGEGGHVAYLKNFYYGGGAEPGLKDRLEARKDQIDPRAISSIALGPPNADGEGPCVRVGKYGPYIQSGERRATVPPDVAPDELTPQKIEELLSLAATSDEPLGYDPVSNDPIFMKSGRFGPYVQKGTGEDDRKPQNASLLKGMKPEDVTLEVALQLLSLPKKLGVHPENGAEIEVANGKFGPYVKCQTEYRSLPATLSPLDVTFQQAVELLAQPKVNRRQSASKVEPLKMLGVSPVTEQEVKLFEGRYGPYVADGETNASLPKGMPPEVLTLEDALNLLAARAAAGGGKKKKKAARGAKKASPKKATALSTAAKRTPAKKAAKKAAKKKAAKKTSKKAASDDDE